MTDESRAALRALWDCGCIRTGPGRRDYGALVADGFADVFRKFHAGAYRYDYRLTMAGRLLAQELFR